MHLLNYLWRLLIENAFIQCQLDFDERVTNHMGSKGLNEDDARKLVYHNILSTY